MIELALFCIGAYILFYIIMAILIGIGHILAEFMPKEKPEEPKDYRWRMPGDSLASFKR